MKLAKCEQEPGMLETALAMLTMPVECLCPHCAPLRRRSDVVALVLDASECADTGAERFVVTQQDFRLAELVAEEGRACMLVINKWDTVPNKTANSHVTFKDEALNQLRAVNWATVLFTSASTGDSRSSTRQPFPLPPAATGDCAHAIIFLAAGH